MKKFFQKLKMDAKFARAGEGHKLTDDTRSFHAPATSQQSYTRTRPMTSSQAQAGAAALARHEELSKQTKVVKPVMMTSKMKAEALRSIPPTSLTRTSSPVEEPEKNSSSIDNHVMFHSPFNDEIIAKCDLKDHMRENLLSRLSTNPVEASSLMIETLNSSQEKKAAAISTINKYLNNIIDNPKEEKYRKIRKSNKVFSEKVGAVEGTEQFLEAIGFKVTVMDGETYYMLESANAGQLRDAQEILSSAEALQFRIHRDRKVFLPTGAKPPNLYLPDQFYKLTSSEMKREQERRTEEIEVNKQLRTKAMRDAGKTTMKFNYTIIRIKFPDEKLLQGTFRASDTINTLREFIRENINVGWAVYSLKTPLGESIDDDGETLLSYKLVPSAIINLSWNEEVRREIFEQQGINLSLVSS